MHAQPDRRAPALPRQQVGQHAAVGFTLIEIMVVLVIIGLLAGVIVANVAGRDDQARQSIARTDMEGIANALDTYKLDNFHYPSTEQGLAALVERPSGTPEAPNWSEKGYLRKRTVPKDPWGNEYKYEYSNGSFDIVTYGADASEGGEGLDADIHYQTE